MARGSAPGLARVAFRRHRVRPVAEHFAADPADRRHLHLPGRADTAGCQRVGGNTFVLGDAARRGRAECQMMTERLMPVAAEILSQLLALPYEDQMDTLAYVAAAFCYKRDAGHVT